MFDAGYCDAQVRREKGAVLLGYAQHAAEAHLAIVLVELTAGQKWVVWTYNRIDGGFSSGTYFEPSNPQSEALTVSHLIEAYKEFGCRVARSVNRL
jgi:hypothetical protein